ncbi:hypothetical protein AZF37_09030 [endosymbiont 'TC1' of Trimyema compressum]|uniref:hypothetical protein n=1 Tax=endosymbiont 'TC1' of Trimyema compressum TaxID=243899 RepID=UPI0007F12482|nr:hypothetical protein [endosymbiont 'TC1' of Trimyema compressum]AMP21266.1 hypothetical protein AZF37_09030 [endosymbiont 'TC1' of Trimyema compressum]
MAKVPNSFIGSFDTESDGHFTAGSNWSYIGQHAPDGDTAVYEYMCNDIISNNNNSDTTLNPVFSNLHIKSNIGITD